MRQGLLLQEHVAKQIQPPVTLEIDTAETYSKDYAGDKDRHAERQAAFDEAALRLAEEEADESEVRVMRYLASQHAV